MQPIVREERERSVCAAWFKRSSSSAMACSTRWRSSGLTFSTLLITRDTLPSETPARVATSLMPGLSAFGFMAKRLASSRWSLNLFSSPRLSAVGCRFGGHLTRPVCRRRRRPARQGTARAKDILPACRRRFATAAMALAKSRPGKLSYASAGLGSPQHLAGALFCRQTGIDALHAPYKGRSPALADLLSGQVDCTIDTLSASL